MGAADKKINFEEFEKLSYIVNMPFRKIEPKDHDHLMFPTIRLFTKASLPLWLCPQWYKHKGHKLQKRNQARDNLQAAQERVQRLTAQREKFRAQSAKFKPEQDSTEEASATAGGLLDRRRTEFNDENVCILWGDRQEAALQAAIQEEEQAEHLLRKRLKPKGTSTYNLVLSALIFVSIINALWINPGLTSRPLARAQSYGYMTDLFVWQHLQKRASLSRLRAGIQQTVSTSSSVSG